MSYLLTKNISFAFPFYNTHHLMHLHTSPFHFNCMLSYLTYRMNKPSTRVAKTTFCLANRTMSTKLVTNKTKVLLVQIYEHTWQAKWTTIFKCIGSCPPCPLEHLTCTQYVRSTNTFVLQSNKSTHSTTFQAHCRHYLYSSKPN